jgi:hypothetical protein
MADEMAKLEAAEAPIAAYSRASDASALAPAPSPQYAPAAASAAGSSMLNSVQAQTQTDSAGEQFVFTFNEAASIAANNSAMLPLVSLRIQSEKALVFRGSEMRNATVHPAITAEIANTSDTSLPAGPITVYDSGIYAGDALLEFLNAGEKRLVSWGEDLSVSGSMEYTFNREAMKTASLSNGIMRINTKLIYHYSYSLHNRGASAKDILIEQDKLANAALTQPATFKEETDNVYRFALTLDAGESTTFEVQQEQSSYQQVTLSRLSLDDLLSYSTSGDIPPAVQAALKQASDLKKAANDASNAVTALQTQRSALAQDQDRIRQNLTAAGNNTPQGQAYLQRMAEQDTQLDDLAKQITSAQTAADAAQKAYEDYIAGLSL